MIDIRTLKDELILDINGHSELLTVRYAMILEDWGFVLNSERSRYVLSGKGNIQLILNDLLGYLQKRNIPIRITDEVNILINEVKDEKERFQKSKELGKAIKGDKISAMLKIKGFKRELKSYQEKAVKQMIAVENSANFSVPGSGKTTMIYATYAHFKQEGKVEKIFVIGTSSCFIAWEEEFTGCFGKIPISVRLIGNNRSGKYKNIDEADVILTTFQTATNDIDKIITILKQYKTLLVIDESHYIKRLNNGVWAEELLRLSPYAVYRIISTGTPMPNGLNDLYTQMTFLWPGKELLGEKNRFKYELKKKGAVENVKERIFPFFCRVKKSDLNLPEPILHTMKIPMSMYQQKLYNLLVTNTLNEVANFSIGELEVLVKWKKAKMIRLLQLASNPALLESYSKEFEVPPLSFEDEDISKLIKQYLTYEVPNKLIEAVRLTGELVGKGEKVLIWVTFINNITCLKLKIEQLGIKVYTLFGEVPKSSEENEDYNREQQIIMFKNSQQPCVMIANPAACAESISLHHHCHHAIYFERSFNCGHYLQSRDRIHRIGLLPNVETHYYLLISEKSIDEIVNIRLEEKANDMYEVIDCDFPPVNCVMDEPEWSSKSELDIDFTHVINYLRKMIDNK